MASKTDCRLTIDVNSVPRKLITILETKERGVIIRLWNANHITHLEYERDNTEKIKYQRYNIHSSPNSPDKNVIKHILELESGRQVITYHHTKALKRTKRFAPLFFRMCPDLADIRYTDTKIRKRISIGQYRPDAFTLLYGVFVGPRDLKISLKEPHSDMGKVTNIVVGDFCVSIIYTFINLFSTNEGELTHVTSSPPNTMGFAETNIFTTILEDGSDPDDCAAIAFNHFLKICPWKTPRGDKSQRGNRGNQKRFEKLAYCVFS
ncbi:hypothetical protein F1642_04935 [Paracoccus sp. NBH48]|uniref:hypothetical protein n=1 Tax=Paracoccus sp. NBH48 TaxID=2596918 RepID=UPI001890ECD2|nr:hypothetical protein [Paracoccus sp. NBH48]MBF5078509.1 hypothetical protein [Paracoccus sp. NBH48]